MVVIAIYPNTTSRDLAFYTVGRFYGVYPTLLIILLTAILGTFLVKTQGINVLKEIQNKLNGLENPTEPIDTVQ